MLQYATFEELTLQLNPSVSAKRGESSLLHTSPHFKSLAQLKRGRDVTFLIYNFRDEGNS